MRIRGVNLGGWLNTEPFITCVAGSQASLTLRPALYEPFYNATIRAVDEWTLGQCVGCSRGVLTQLRNLDAVSSTNKATVMNAHYSTFIVRGRARAQRLSRAQTEQDFAQIAGAGLNWVRIPIPFYMCVSRVYRANSLARFETYPNEPFPVGPSRALPPLLTPCRPVAVSAQGLPVGPQVRHPDQPRHALLPGLAERLQPLGPQH